MELPLLQEISLQEEVVFEERKPLFRVPSVVLEEQETVQKKYESHSITLTLREETFPFVFTLNPELQKEVTVTLLPSLTC